VLEVNDRGWAILTGQNLDLVVDRFVRAFRAGWEGVGVMPGDVLNQTYTLKILPNGELEPVPFLVRSRETQ
jgi:hypothetical protein